MAAYAQVCFSTTLEIIHGATPDELEPVVAAYPAGD
jgi:hypothetical protein